MTGAVIFPTGNERVRMTGLEVLSDNWYVLRKAFFDYRDADGNWSAQAREAYDRGNGATILLVDWGRGTILLTRQFRVPAYLNGHADGMLIETPGGLLDEDDPEAAVVREAEEETGVRPGDVHFLFDLYMSPGSVTERVAFYVGEYRAGDLTRTRAGVAEEGEDIEVLELAIDDAVDMVERGDIVDGKTVILLQWLRLEQRRRAGT